MNNHIGYRPTIRWEDLTNAEIEEIVREAIQLVDEHLKGI